MTDYRGIPINVRPITRPRADADGNALASRRVLGHMLGRNPELISRYCQPVACDVTTRALLYAAEQVGEAFATRARRARRPRTNTELSSESA